MPIFPVLEIESLVQENDKTRFKADKTYFSGSSHIGTIEIRPFHSGEYYTLLDDSYFLDWQYEFKIEIISDVNNQLDFKEGSTFYTAVLTDGEYTLSELAEQIQMKMNLVGALTYVVAVSDDDELTISAEAAFSLLGKSGANASTSILPSIGFNADKAGKASYEGSEIQTIQKRVTLKVFASLEITASNNKIDFSLPGLVVRQATVPPATYNSLATLMAAIEDALNDAASSDDVVFVVAESEDGKIAIGADVEFSLLISSGVAVSTSLYPSIGFTGPDFNGETSYISGVVPSFKFLHKYVSVISERADHLFSTDDLLVRHESDILRYVPDGRATFKDVHRRAQTLMMAWLDDQGFIDDLSDPITKRRIKDQNELQNWSGMMALRLIFESISNAKDDVFRDKAKTYRGLEDFYRNKMNFKVDLNQDGNVDIGEALDIKSAYVVRR